MYIHEHLFFRIRVGRILTRFAISQEIIESLEFNMRSRRDAGVAMISRHYFWKGLRSKKASLWQICLYDLFVLCLKKRPNKDSLKPTFLNHSFEHLKIVLDQGTRNSKTRRGLARLNLSSTMWIFKPKILVLLEQKLKIPNKDSSLN